jgi:hypothetical protein
MKTKLLICSAALSLIVAVLALLLIQGCKKNNTLTFNSPSKDSNFNAPGSTVAYQDNTVTNWFKRNSNSLGSIAFDQAFSVPLSSGKVLWLTGDVYYKDLNTDGTTTPCLFNYHNSVLQQPSTTNWTQSSTTNLLYATSPQIFTDFSPNYFWPCTGVEIGTKVYTYLVEMNGTSYVGGKLGVLNEADNSVDYSTALPSLNGISFNIGMIKIGSYVYVYGYKLTGTYAISNIYVARFATSAPGTWTFWNGSSWVSSATSAAAIAQTSSNAASVGYVNNKFVLINTYWSLQCSTTAGADAVYGSTSSNATGPFTAPITIYHIPDRKAGAIPFFYTPLIHPEFTANSEFLFTYCINGYAPCTASCISNKAIADDYRPRAVRVPFSVLGL